MLAVQLWVRFESYRATKQISGTRRQHRCCCCVYHQKCKCHLRKQPRQSLCRPLRLHSLTCLPPRQQKQRGRLGIAAAECEQREQALGEGREGIVEQSQRTAEQAHALRLQITLRLGHSSIPPILSSLCCLCALKQTHMWGPNFSATLGQYRRYIHLVGYENAAPVGHKMILNEAFTLCATPWLMRRCILDAWHKSRCAVGPAQTRQVLY